MPTAAPWRALWPIMMAPSDRIRLVGCVGSGRTMDRITKMLTKKRAWPAPATVPPINAASAELFQRRPHKIAATGGMPVDRANRPIDPRSAPRWSPRAISPRPIAPRPIIRRLSPFVAGTIFEPLFHSHPTADAAEVDHDRPADYHPPAADA